MSTDHHQDTFSASPTLARTFNSCLEEIKSDISLLKVEQGVQSPGADTRAQLQSACPSLDTYGSIAHASILGRRPTECGPSKFDTHSITPSYRVHMNLALAKLGAQRLRAVKKSADNFIEQRFTYLVPAVADFKGTRGCRLFGVNKSSRDRSSLLRFVFKALPDNTDSHWVWLLFTSYAALHLSAWNSHFPTTTERWMWRGAGLVIVAGTALSLILVYVFLFTINLNRKRCEAGLPDATIRNALIGSLQILNLLFLIRAMAASRLYFLVEAFVSLRAPAPRTYETVEWTNFWPHW